MAEDKKEARHKRMYKDSPKLERDKESGKMGVSKKRAEADDESGGPAKMPEHEGDMMDMHQRHAKERMELSQKHDREYMDAMHQRMQQQAAAAPEGAAGGGDDAAQDQTQTG